ncbi:MAG: hypothetical protein JRF33_15260, partial [Deltaproteobacteria bacterium]|nr:hypothetical protein [Deltaproteobacteria bacterium]
EEEAKRKEEEEAKRKEEEEAKRKEEEEAKRKEEERKSKKEKERKQKTEPEKPEGRMTKDEIRREATRQISREVQAELRGQTASEDAPAEPPPMEADRVWREALAEFDLVGRDLGIMARLASSWADDRLADQEIPVLEDEAEKWAKPTMAGADELATLLAKEAARARELAAIAVDDDDDAMHLQLTIPSLPPKPLLEAKQASPGASWQVESLDEAGTSGKFDKEKTEDLVFDFAAGDLLTSQESLVLPSEGSDFARPDEQTSPRLISLDEARTAQAGKVARDDDEARPRRSMKDLPAQEEAEADFFTPGKAPQLHPADPSEVNLEDELAPLVLWRMLRQSVTGKMVFTSAGAEKEVFFEEGVPVAVRSSLRGDRLEELLLREGWIDREAYAEARVKEFKQPRVLAALLVERGHLRPEELFPLVRHHLDHCLLGLFEWSKGRAVFEAELVPDAEIVRLGKPLASLILDGIRRKFVLERMVHFLGGSSSLLAPVPAEDRSSKTPNPENLDLTDAERSILRLVNGLRPIEEIGFISGQDANTVYRVLLTGQVLGLIVLVAKGLPGGAKSEAESIRRDLDLRRRRLVARFDQINQASYFGFLGVEEDATAFEITAAHERLHREFHPANYNHPALKDLDSKLALVRRALDEARDVLGDELLRLGYRDSLKQRL